MGWALSGAVAAGPSRCSPRAARARTSRYGCGTRTRSRGPRSVSPTRTPGTLSPWRGIRREAERDAAEARLVAIDHRLTQAIGFSRGARAIVGALAEDPALFDRVALVIPPGGSAAGKYSDWLSSLSSVGRGEMAGEILVVGNRGDQGHPARVAQAWAQQLGAHLEILPPRAVYTDPERVMSLLAEFFC